MTYLDFLTRVIDDGIAAARADYTRPYQAQLLAGSVAAFEACRGKRPIELLDLFNQASALRRDQVDHWYWTGYLNEVEWVCNVVSAVIVNEGDPPLLAWLPTVRGCLKAAEIVGVADRVAS